MTDHGLTIPGEPEPPHLWDLIALFVVAVGLGLLVPWAFR